MTGAFRNTWGGNLFSNVLHAVIRWGRTALHLAVEQNHLPAALYLSEHRELVEWSF